MKKFWKILKRILLSILVLLVIIYLLLLLPPVQNWLGKKAAAFLSNKLHTKVSVNKVKFSLLNKASLEGIFIEDLKKDTLLYAGKVEAKITDWFVFKNDVELKYASIDNAFIHFNRTDSIWNYQFLANFFSGDTSSKKSSTKFNLKEVHLSNIRFLQEDKWLGNTQLIRVGKLNLEADKIDFSNKKAIIKKLEIVKPTYGEESYKPLKIPVSIVSEAAISDTEIIKIDTEKKWQIQAGEISLNDGLFFIHKPINTPLNNYFDDRKIEFKEINAKFRNLNVINDSLSSMMQLTTKERGGLIVKKFDAIVQFHSNALAFSNLDLQTNKSKLSNAFAMRYKNFNKDFSSFLENVILDANFDNSIIETDDIAFFAPELKSWKKKFILSGIIKGSVTNLSGKKVKIFTGKNTLFQGDFSLTGLPNIDETFIDIQTNRFNTTLFDLYSTIPSLRQVKILQPLQYLRFRGSYTGFIKDFVAYGTFETNLGNFKCDVNMKLPNGKVPIYSGSLNTSGFELGKLLSNEKLGKLSFNGKVKGSGFALKNLYVEVNGKMSQFEFNNYNYSNIEIGGLFDKKLFNGNFIIKDTNVSFSLNGTIDFNNPKPLFDFAAVIDSIHFKEIGFTKDNFKIKGNVYFNFEGNTIDDFTGTAKLNNASFTKDEKKLPLDTLVIYSSFENERKKIVVESNELKVSLLGKFNFEGLSDAVILFLNKYFPAYIDAPANKNISEDFVFNIEARNVEDYISLIHPNLKGFNNSDISASVNLNANQLKLKAYVPEFSYNGIVFSNTEISDSSDLQKMYLNTSIGYIKISDSFTIPRVNLSVVASNDISDINISTGSSQALNGANLSAKVKTAKDFIRIHFNPSSFILNEKTWNLENNGELTISKKLLTAENILFTSGIHEISIESDIDEDSEKSSLIVNLKKINVYDFTPLFIKSPRLEGIITGKIILKDPFGKMQLNAVSTIEQFRFENDSIGTLNSNVDFSNNRISFNANVDNSKYNFIADGIINLKDTLLNVRLQLSNSGIGLLEYYIGTIINNIQARASGEISLVGKIYDPDMVGKISLKDASMNLRFTQCTYNLNDPVINFNKGEIDFGKIILTDKFNNKGNFKGKIFHRLFNKMSLDLEFNSPKLLLLNTTSSDNKVFYGKAIGSVSQGSLKGPVEDLKFFIAAESSPTDSSTIVLNTGITVRQTSAYPNVFWRKYGRDVNIRNNPKASNMAIDLNLVATPAATIKLVLDEATSDAIIANGSGNIILHTGTHDNLEINGQYSINSGKYTFNSFNNLIKLDFDLLPGGSVVWNKQDPYDASINIDAQYKKPKVDLRLISSNPSRPLFSDVNIIAQLRNSLKEPEVTMRYELRENATQEAKSDIVLQNNLKRLSSNKNEGLEQVPYILLLGTFFTTNQTLTTNNPFTGTIGQIISAWTTSTLTNVMKKLFNDNTIEPIVSIDPQINTRDNANSVQTTATFGIAKSIMNGKIVIKAAGNVDYNNNPNLAVSRKSAVLVSPDVTIEWLLNENGTIRLVGFSKSNFDILGIQYIRNGVGISFTKEFDTFKQLFKNENKKENKKPG